MRKTRKLLSLLLVLCMFATFAPAAFAADSTETVEALADGAGQKDEKEIGNVTVSSESDALGIYASANNSAEASVAANGDVSATGKGENEVSAYAAQVAATNGGTATATVSGNAAASATGTTDVPAGGANSNAYGGGGTATVTVSGDASATSTSEDYAYASGAEAFAMDGGKASVTVSGNASAESNGENMGYAYGAEANATGGSTATATVTGNASATGTNNSTAVDASASDGGTATATANGNATATANGDYSSAAGVSVYTTGGTASATAGGDATATSNVATASATGIRAYAMEGGTATATVDGNATATANEDGYANGVAASAGEGSALNVTVGGDVEATGGSVMGISAYADCGTTTVEVAGDVSAAGNQFGAIGISITAGGEGAVTTVSVGGSVEASGEASRGVMVNTCENATSILEVSGDVTAEGCGLYLYSYDGGANATTDILVEGTVKGGGDSILVASVGQEKVITLTVWKAELNSDGDVVSTNDYSTAKEMNKDNPEALARIEQFEKEVKETAKKVEENILYIIKYEDPENGTVSLAGTVQSHGLDAAKEGDTVTLKALAKDGYKMVGAFNGTDTKTSLMQDANGDYYIVVPKGGGVFLTVKMEKIPTPAESNTAPAYDYVPVPAAKEGTVTVAADAVETTQGYDVDISDSESAAELKAALLTGDEQKEVAEGKDVKVIVEYKPASVSAADEKKVQDEIGSAKIATWLNVSVFKQVEGAEKVQVEKPNGKITLQIVAPDDIIALAADGTPFEVVSIVNGKVVRIPAVYNAKTRTIDFETDFFGVFALVYGE